MQANVAIAVSTVISEAVCALADFCHPELRVYAWVELGQMFQQPGDTVVEIPCITSPGKANQSLILVLHLFTYVRTFSHGTASLPVNR